MLSRHPARDARPDENGGDFLQRALALRRAGAFRVWIADDQLAPARVRHVPGAVISAATYTTAGKASRPVAALIFSALSTPFWRLTTTAPGERWGASARAAASVSYVLTARRTSPAPRDRRGIVRRLHDHAARKALRVEEEALRRDRLDVRRAADERHRRSRAREHRAEVAADGARTHHGHLRPGRRYGRVAHFSCSLNARVRAILPCIRNRRDSEVEGGGWRRLTKPAPASTFTPSRPPRAGVVQW